MNPLTFSADKPMDFIAIGRVCIDLNANEIHRPMEETRTFTKYLGGSPANIAVAMSRLGMKTGFIGKLSDDQMGRYLRQYFSENGIDTAGLVTDHTGAVTGLAFTEIKSPTDCSILMYRDNAADLLLTSGEVSEDYVRQARVLLVSGTALAASPSREAVFTAMTYARRHGVRVIFDLDYRPYTWKSAEETATYYQLAAEKCDVIIGTREEFDMMEGLTRSGDGSDAATARMWFGHHAEIVVIKHGGEGSIAYTRDGASHRGTIFPAKVVKTFGAGDSYAGAFIFSLMRGRSVAEAMEYGAANASMVISCHSCSDAMPTLEKLENFIGKCKRGEITRENFSLE